MQAYINLSAINESILTMNPIQNVIAHKIAVSIAEKCPEIESGVEALITTKHSSVCVSKSITGDVDIFGFPLRYLHESKITPCFTPALNLVYKIEKTGEEPISFESLEDAVTCVVCAMPSPLQYDFAAELRDYMIKTKTRFHAEGDSYVYREGTRSGCITHHFTVKVIDAKTLTVDASRVENGEYLDKEECKSINVTLDVSNGSVFQIEGTTTLNEKKQPVQYTARNVYDLMRFISLE